MGVMAHRPEVLGIDYLRSTNAGQTWSTPVTLSEEFSRFPFWAPDNHHGVLWMFWKNEQHLGSGNCDDDNRCADIATKYTTDGGLS